MVKRIESYQSLKKEVLSQLKMVIKDLESDDPNKALKRDIWENSPAGDGWGMDTVYMAFMNYEGSDGKASINDMILELVRLQKKGGIDNNE